MDKKVRPSVGAWKIHLLGPELFNTILPLFNLTFGVLGVTQLPSAHHSRFPGFTVIKDIGSGLNYKRKGLLKLLAESAQGRVGVVAVFSRDRLCRFGFELIEWLFTQHNTKLLVYEHSDKTPEEEFTEDILAILQVFACRWNGKRKYSDKRAKDQENQDVPNPVAEEALKEMVRCL